MLDGFGQPALAVEDNADAVLGLRVSRVEVQRLSEMRQCGVISPSLQ
jgi:hypothetical protein